MFMEPRNQFQGINSASLISLAGRDDNPIPTRFLAPIDCLQIPALEFLKSLRGLGTEEKEGYHTSPPGYIGWRNSFLEIDSGAPYTFKNTGSSVLCCDGDFNWLGRVWGGG